MRNRQTGRDEIDYKVNEIKHFKERSETLNNNYFGSVEEKNTIHDQKMVILL